MESGVPGYLTHVASAVVEQRHLDAIALFRANYAGGFTPIGGLTFRCAPPALTVTTASLPGGTVGVAYQQTLSASGGSNRPNSVPGTRDAWSVSVGSLPAGLSLSDSGSISGAPTGAGTVNFTVTVIPQCQRSCNQGAEYCDCAFGVSGAGRRVRLRRARAASVRWDERSGVCR